MNSYTSDIDLLIKLVADVVARDVIAETDQREVNKTNSTVARSAHGNDD
jgi:hypothetical protein